MFNDSTIDLYKQDNNLCIILDVYFRLKWGNGQVDSTGVSWWRSKEDD